MLLKPRQVPTGTNNPSSPLSTLPNAAIADPAPLPLHLRHRPKQFSEIRGEASRSVVAALQAQVGRSDAPHAYLFVGPSGVGKTTLARILADAFQCSETLEIDAASNAGVEAVREQVAAWQSRPLTGGAKMVILDECHALSKAAWQPLLKILEEPPKHLYVCLCTTESSKVPPTIRTRCAEYALPPLSRKSLLEYLDEIPETHALPESIKTALLAYADGSMRRLLTGADKVLGVTELATAQAVLAQASQEEDGAALGIARILASGRWSWERLRALLADLEDSEAESVRRIVLAYLTKAVLAAATEDRAGPLVQALDAFTSRPFNGVADLVVALFQSGASR